MLSEDQRAAHVFDHNPRHGTDLRAGAGRRAGPGVNNLDVQSIDALRQTTQASVNIAWSPVPRVDRVIEGLAGRRVNKEGREGKAGQVRFGSTFRF